MVIDPTRFRMKDFGGDGPCHSDELIKLFWADVLKSLKVSLALMKKQGKTSGHGKPRECRKPLKMTPLPTWKKESSNSEISRPALASDFR
jgi:hypothetical protein